MSSLVPKFLIAFLCTLGAVNGVAQQTSTAPEKPAENPAKAQQSAAPATIEGAAELLGKLKPDQLKTVASMIEENWTDRPEWVEMAIAVMRDQAMVQGAGWWRTTEKKYGWTWLRRQFDKNADNSIDREEFAAAGASSDLYLRRLDQNLDGHVTSADFDTSIYRNATPEATLNRLTQFLFSHLDFDTNGQVTKEELAEFFDAADTEKSSFLTAEDLFSALNETEAPRSADDSGPTTSDMMTMFFRGQLGWFEEGPKLGERAPDFTLPTHESDRTINLAALIEKKPVVLIFGSFT